MREFLVNRFLGKGHQNSKPSAGDIKASAVRQAIASRFRRPEPKIYMLGKSTELCPARCDGCSRLRRARCAHCRHGRRAHNVVVYLHMCGMKADGHHILGAAELAPDHDSDNNLLFVAPSKYPEIPPSCAARILVLDQLKRMRYGEWRPLRRDYRPTWRLLVFLMGRFSRQKRRSPEFHSYGMK